MKVRILGSVTHNNVELEMYKVYDLPDRDAQGLVDGGIAEVPNGEEVATPEPETKPREKKAEDEPYVAEAIIDPEKKKKLEAEGKLDDPLPVVEPKKEKDPVEETFVEGQEDPNEPTSGKPQE